MMCGRHNALGIATKGFFFACRQCLLLAVGERAMRGVLGEKIGEGVFADIHAWAPGQVVKLFKGGIPRRVSRWEARMTRAVFAAGGPASEVLGEVSLDGRYGFVLPRFEGPTLLQLTKSGAITFERAGAILASLFLAVHNTPPPPDVLPLRDVMSDLMNGSSLLAGGAVPRHIATGVLALIERLPPGDGLCHGDLHPENVMMTADGPRIIDWGVAVRAPAALDLARCHVTLSEVAVEVADDPQRPRAVNAAAQSEYARLAGMSEAALTAAMEPYLPIARVHPLLGRPAPALRDMLVQLLEASLCSQG
jgi:Phosphotransferase enzyme family